MNLRLFLLLVVIESLFVIVGFYGLILIFFLYFGSGAGATSDKAMLTENIDIGFGILFLMPLLFGILKFRNVTEKLKAKSYLYSGLLVTIVSGIYFGLNV